jgi:hypothetical protein
MVRRRLARGCSEFWAAVNDCLTIRFGCYLLYAGTRAAFFFHGHRTGVFRTSNVLILLIGVAAVWFSSLLYRRLGGRLAPYSTRPSQ